MADPTATAFVEIRPDLTRFEAELRVGIREAAAKVAAPVKVTPILTGFQAALRAQLKTALPTGVPVKIVPNLTGFQTLLRGALKESIPAAVPVQIRPVLAPGSRTALQAEIAELNLVGRIRLVLAPGTRTQLQERVAKMAPLAVQLRPVLAPGARTEEQTQVAKQTPLAAFVRPVLVPGFRKLLQEQMAAMAPLVGRVRLALAPGQRAALVEQVAGLGIGGAAVGGEAAAGIAGVGAAAAAAEAPLLVFESTLSRLGRVGASGVEATKRSVTRIAEAAAGATHPLTGMGTALKRVSEALAGVERTTAGTVKVTGDFVPLSQRMVLQLEAEAAAGNKAAAALLARDAAIKAGRTVLTPAAVVPTAAAAAAPATTVTAGARSSAGATGRAASSQTSLANATGKTTKAISEQAEVMQRHSSQLSRFNRGIAATGLAMFGLRGATLAATSAFLAGAASIALLAKGIGFASKFAQQLSVFKAVTGATASQLHAVSEAAIALGQDFHLPGVTAIDAAEAMTELSKAGLSVQDSIAGARGVLQLAGAANISFAEATNLAASAINAFHLAGADAVHVADVLANAANLAQGSIVDIGIAFQQAAAVGHQAGLTFEDTTSFITDLAKAGLTGSDAGTSLRTALIRLLNPTAKAQKIIDQLGVSLRDANGNLRPELFVNLGHALEGVTKAQRDQILATLGGQDAVRAFAILTNENIRQLIAQRDALHKSGTAQTVAQARMTQLAGAGANLSNTLQDIGLKLGQKVTPSLTNFVNGLREVVTGVSKSSFVTGALAQTASTIGNVFQTLGGAIRSVAPAISTVGSALGKAITVINPATILAGAAAYFTLGKSIKSVKTGLDTLAKAQKAVALAEAAQAAATTAASLANTTRQLEAAQAALATTKVGFLTRSFLGLQVALGGIRRTTAASSAAFTAAGGGIAGLGASASTASRAIGLGFKGAVLGAARSMNVWVVGIAAAAAGLAFLITRESDSERATRRFKGAVDDLVVALENQRAAEDSLLGAKIAQKADAAAVAEAKRTKAIADRQLERSNAPVGSQERFELTTRAAVAADNLKLAQDQLAISNKRLDDAQRVSNAAIAQSAQKRVAEAKTINDVIGSHQRLIEALKARRDAAIDFNEGQSAIDVATSAVNFQLLRQHKEITKTIKDRIAVLKEEGAAGNVDALNTAQRLQKILVLTTKVRDLSRVRPVIDLILKTGSLEKGLRLAIQKADDSGQKSVAAYLREWLAGLSGDDIAGAVAGALAGAVDVSAAAGLAAGNAWLANFLAPLAALNTFLNKVQGAAARRASNQAESVGQQLTRAQIGGASPAQQIAIARREVALRDRALAAADAAVAAASKKTTGSAADRKKRLDNARKAQADAVAADKAAHDELTNLIEQNASDQKAKADAAKQKKDDADQAFLDALSFKRGAFDLAFEIAKGTKQLTDDIAAQKAYTATLTIQIATIQKSSLSEAKKAEAIQELKVARQQSINATGELVAQQREFLARQKEATKQAIINRRDRQEESLNLDIQTAQAKDNEAQEKKAHQALLRFLIARQKHTDEGSVEWKRLQLKIEQERAAIRELDKATKDRNDAGKSLTFEFLQAQQGFASTILGNLLPFGSTAGAVGGTAKGITSPTPFVPTGGFATAVHTRPKPGSTGSGIRDTFGPRQPNMIGVGAQDAAGGPLRPPDIVDVAVRLSKTTGEAAGPRGPTGSQLAVLIHVARLQLQAIQKLAGQNTHPESKTSRVTQPVDYATH